MWFLKQFKFRFLQFHVQICLHSSASHVCLYTLQICFCVLLWQLLSGSGWVRYELWIYEKKKGIAAPLTPAHFTEGFIVKVLQRWCVSNLSVVFFFTELVSVLVHLQSHWIQSQPRPSSSCDSQTPQTTTSWIRDSVQRPAFSPRQQIPQINTQYCKSYGVKNTHEVFHICDLLHVLTSEWTNEKKLFYTGSDLKSIKLCTVNQRSVQIDMLWCQQVTPSPNFLLNVCWNDRNLEVKIKQEVNRRKFYFESKPQTECQRQRNNQSEDGIPPSTDDVSEVKC